MMSLRRVLQCSIAFGGALSEHESIAWPHLPPFPPLDPTFHGRPSPLARPWKGSVAGDSAQAAVAVGRPQAASRSAADCASQRGVKIMTHDHGYCL